MTIEERLRGLILSRFPTVKDFAAEAGINYSTMLTVFKRGLDNTGISNIQKICQTLGITMEGLCNDRIEFCKPQPANVTDFRSHQNRLLLCLMEQTVTIDDVPLTQDEALLVDDFLTAAADTIRRRREREARS